MTKEEDDRIHYIYLTTNLINNHKYLGKHYGYLDDDYLGSGNLIKAAIKKYGKENFKKEILHISKDAEENSSIEHLLIVQLQLVDDPNFYNLSAKVDGFDKTQNKDYTKTEEFRKKMSEVTKGDKNGMYGRHHTEESKKLMSENRKGLATGDKNGMYGKSNDKALNGKWILMLNQNKEPIHIFKAKTAVLAYLGLKGHIQLNRAIEEGTLFKDHYWIKLDKYNKNIQEIMQIQDQLLEDNFECRD